MKTTINTIHNSKKNANFGLKKRPFQAKIGENDPFESDIFIENKITYKFIYAIYMQYFQLRIYYFLQQYFE